MSREKQIDEMAKDLETVCGCVRNEDKAGALYDTFGWRKQSEGEWLEQVRVSKEGKPLLRHYKCNLCGVYLATQANYCPNCGAKMKGGVK